MSNKAAFLANLSTRIGSPTAASGGYEAMRAKAAITPKPMEHIEKPASIRKKRPSKLGKRNSFSPKAVDGHEYKSPSLVSDSKTAGGSPLLSKLTDDQTKAICKNPALQPWFVENARRMVLYHTEELAFWKRVMTECDKVIDDDEDEAEERNAPKRTLASRPAVSPPSAVSPVASATSSPVVVASSPSPSSPASSSSSSASAAAAQPALPQKPTIQIQRKKPAPPGPSIVAESSEAPEKPAVAARPPPGPSITVKSKAPPGPSIAVKQAKLPPKPTITIKRRSSKPAVPASLAKPAASPTPDAEEEVKTPQDAPVETPPVEEAPAPVADTDDEPVVAAEEPAPVHERKKSIAERFGGISMFGGGVPTLQKRTSTRDKIKPVAEAPEKAASAACKDCGCTDYKKHPFKKTAQCQECYHDH